MPSITIRYLLPGLLAPLAMTAAGGEPLAIERTGQWPVAEPAAMQVDGGALNRLEASIRAGEYGYIDSLLVIRAGHIVFDERFEQDYATANAPFDAPVHMHNYQNEQWHPWLGANPALHTMQSVSKSVLAVLYGIAQRQGVLPPLETPALALLGNREFADPDGRKARISLEDLLTMRAGIEWDEETYPYTDPRNICAVMEASEDWVQVVLDQPMAAEPGSTWVYNSGVTILLAAILERLTGQKLAAYAEAELFGPLGIEEYFWKHTPLGLADAEGGLYLAPGDMARIMLLMLNDGAWNGRQLMAPGWAGQSTAPATRHVYPDWEAWKDVGYGYQWWELARALGLDSPAYTGIGYGGQWPVTVPERDLIIVLTGWNVYGKNIDVLAMLRERLLPAVK